MTGPQPTVAHAFAELAETLVADFDLVEFMHQVAVRSQQALGTDAVGLLLADNHGGLNVMAASSDQARLLELFQLQNAEGPCLDSYRTNAVLSVPDLSSAAARWPRFVALTMAAGFLSVHAIPLRLRDQAIGGMNLFSRTPGLLDPETLDMARALADMASIGLLHERAIRERDLLAQQLQSALTSRLSIEQAKGVVAESAGVGIGEAFDMLIAYAHHHGYKLAELADEVVRGDRSLAASVGRVDSDLPSS
jgi:transcriptional regulator with GAF, ATPase, and Fis domain